MKCLDAQEKLYIYLYEFSLFLKSLSNYQIIFSEEYLNNWRIKAIQFKNELYCFLTDSYSEIDINYQSLDAVDNELNLKLILTLREFLGEGTELK